MTETLDETHLVWPFIKGFMMRTTLIFEQGLIMQRTDWTGIQDLLSELQFTQFFILEFLEKVYYQKR